MRKNSNYSQRGGVLMNEIFLILILFVSGCAIVATIFFANKALSNFMRNNKGINQNSNAVICPKCGTKNKRQVNGQQCRNCNLSF
jgi:Zn finger protein HypA/HybF involved in hydrogenase expression